MPTRTFTTSARRIALARAGGDNRGSMKWARRVLIAAGVIVVGIATLTALTPTGRYIVRAAWAEARILAARQPIDKLSASPDIRAATRAKLGLVLAAREFARDGLALRAEESFTAYSEVDRDTLVLVLSAAQRDRLEPVTWWFPVVGRVPYKGFFDFDLARESAHAMREDGYDTYLRPASAFSTLGYFNDPLLSTTLRLDSVSLVNTVIHEITHNSFYASGQAVFNESFANFVGSRGAELFFARFKDERRAELARADWHDEMTMGRFWSGLYRSLDSAFDAHPGSAAERLSARDKIYARARTTLRDDVAPSLMMPATRGAIARQPLDNAVLLARRIYVTDLDLFDAAYALEGSDLSRSVRRIMSLARSRPDDPYGAVRDWVASKTTK
ncbi:MAG: aminopeptidase [Gemmatimonadaceae bacterium]